VRDKGRFSAKRLAIRVSMSLERGYLQGRLVLRASLSRISAVRVCLRCLADAVQLDLDKRVVLDQIPYLLHVEPGPTADKYKMR